MTEMLSKNVDRKTCLAFYRPEVFFCVRFVTRLGQTNCPAKSADIARRNIIEILTKLFFGWVEYTK